MITCSIQRIAGSRIAAEQGGQPERRIGRVLRSTVLGRRRVTLVVLPVNGCAMTFDADTYRKRWPRGLVKYHDAACATIPASAIDFLSHVGLPCGCEPEWNFNGELLSPPIGYQFGTRGIAPLVITTTGQVIRLRDDEQTYVNASIKHFAECLTLRKGPYRFGSSINDVTDLRLAFENADASAVVGTSLWGQYLIECEEEEREITDSMDAPSRTGRTTP